jgi:dTMP kinase
VKGLFITFEGTEGSGKTTQISLLTEWLDQRKIPYLAVREPGGTKIGDLIRNILLNNKLTEMKQRTEILLYAASRAQLVEQKILPALQAGQLVICDRYLDSSVVYQSLAANWDLKEVLSVNQVATGGLKPIRTYLLDLPIEIGQKRLMARRTQKDRIEQKELAFHQRVREGYLKLAEEEPNRFRVISADQKIQRIHQQIIDDLFPLLTRFSDPIDITIN